jgi:hypothetical protein
MDPPALVCGSGSLHDGAKFLPGRTAERLRAKRTDDTPDYYKTQCVSCLGDKAELKFDQNTLTKTL